MAALLSHIDDVLALVPVLVPGASTDAIDGVVRAAVFDADGTLWRGDIGDAAFEAAVSAGLVEDATVAGPLRAWAARWGLVIDGDNRGALARIIHAASTRALEATERSNGWIEGTWREELYAMQAWIYAGHTRSEVEAFGAALFEDGFARGIFDDMRRLVDALTQRGVSVWIASASSTALVVPGAARLGIERHRVLGMEPHVDETGIIRPSLRRSTYGNGKALAVREALGGRPLMAFGDSVLSTDRELLALAHVPVAVATKGAHREAALADRRMHLFDPT